MDYFDNIVKNIKNLKIQGATAVAKSALDAIKYVAAKSNAKNSASFIDEICKAKEKLYDTRPTEPLMRNSLRYIIYLLCINRTRTVSELKRMTDVVADEFLSKISEDKERMAVIGAREIRNGMTILTHCHSSTVTNMFRHAKKQGKKFSVICTETRPNYQGRITAKELVSLKIPTTMIIDSAVPSFIKKVDAVFVGCDLITADVSVVNKIGTNYISVMAQKSGVPFYCFAELAKFDPETMFGKPEEIEYRPGKEVWDKAPKKLNIVNPIFDITPRANITAFITPEGIIPPSGIMELINKKLPWIFKGVR